jgi:hypothetical protein
MGCEQPNTRALITPEIARHLVRIQRRPDLLQDALVWLNSRMVYSVTIAPEWVQSHARFWFSRNPLFVLSDEMTEWLDENNTTEFKIRHTAIEKTWIVVAIILGGLGMILWSLLSS